VRPVGTVSSTGAVSTADMQKVMADPLVRRALELTGGSLARVRVAAPARPGAGG